MCDVLLICAMTSRCANDKKVVPALKGLMKNSFLFKGTLTLVYTCNIHSVLLK